MADDVEEAGGTSDTLQVADSLLSPFSELTKETTLPSTIFSSGISGISGGTPTLNLFDNLPVRIKFLILERDCDMAGSSMGDEGPTA